MNDRKESCAFAHSAMHTRYEIFMHHDDRVYASQAAAEAFRILDGLEQALSLFISNSDVSRLNNAAGKPVVVGLDAFECIQKAVDLSRLTGGAFDVTAKSGGRFPPSWETITLDGNNYSITMAAAVRVDLGGIGKGFAVDRMADVLREWEIGNALIHGGASTAFAMGHARPHGSGFQPDGSGWKVTVSVPEPLEGPEAFGGSSGTSRHILETLFLENGALGGSGMEKGPHIIDPQSGKPVSGRTAAWALAPDAVSADVLSTAFMIMMPEAIDGLCADHPAFGALTVTAGGRIHRSGRWIQE